MKRTIRRSGDTARLAALAMTLAAATGCIGKIEGGAGGDGGGDRPPPVIVPGVHCDDERPGPRQLRLLTRREYAATVRDLLGVDVDTSTIPVEPKVKGFDNNASAMVVTSRHMDAYLALAETAIDKSIATQRAKILKCDPAAAACKSQFVTDLGLRAFRRPLTDEEATSFGKAFDGNSFDDGMRIAVGAMMVSTAFLYRSEIGEIKNGVAQLTPYETASALSYLYWGSMPDDALFAAAKAGKLSSADELTAQARRLLADGRAKDQVANFTTQWLHTEDTLEGSKDDKVYPNLTPAVREAMAEEQRRLVTDVMFEQKGSLKDLFLADYVWVNDALARFYGLPSPGAQFTKVKVDVTTGRGGLLGLGSVLSSHAHSNESSPIKRGVFVRGRLLCQDLPPPPPDVDATPPGLDPTLTTRERFARHDADPACAGCHQYLDGVGFGFEGFDGDGSVRLKEAGVDVDTSGAVVGLEGLGNSDKVSFKGTRELAQMLADSDAAEACLPTQYFRFARGYTEQSDDSCAIHNLQLSFHDSDANLQDLLVQLAALPTFTTRAAR